MKKIILFFLLAISLAAQTRISEQDSIITYDDQLIIVTQKDSLGVKVWRKLMLSDLEKFMRDSLLITGSITNAMLNGDVAVSKLDDAGNLDKILIVTDAGAVQWQTVSGDLTQNNGAFSIGASKVTTTKIADTTVTNNKLKLAVNSYSTNQTLTLSNYYVNVTTSTTDKTITLPITVPNGTTYNIKKADSAIGWVIIAVSGGGTIDGVSSLSIQYQYSGYTLVKSGNNYLIYGVF